MIIPDFLKEQIHLKYKRMERDEASLLYLFLEITRKCNLKCRHCGSDCKSEYSAEELTSDSWLKIIDDIYLKFKPAPTIVITGGEALLHEDFFKIIDKINSYKMRWGLVSNGYLLDKETIEKLQDKNIYSITVSLDGLEINHNWLRCKKDSYSKTLSALHYLSKCKIPLKDVVTCVNPLNLKELIQISDILLKNKINYWRLFRIFPAGRAKENKELQLNVEETKEMIEWVKKNRKDLCVKGLDVSLSCEGWLPYKVDKKVRNQPFFCRAGINIASILCDGTVTGCSNNHKRFFEGNVLKNSFSYLWKNEFKKFRNREWVKETTCFQCKDYKFCEGSSIHLWRDNLKKPEFCYMDCYK